MRERGGEVLCVKKEVGCYVVRCVRGDVRCVRGEVGCGKGEVGCVKGEVGCVKTTASASHM